MSPTPTEIRVAMALAGLSDEGAAALCGVPAGTVAAWIAAESPMPWEHFNTILAEGAARDGEELERETEKRGRGRPRLPPGAHRAPYNTRLPGWIVAFLQDHPGHGSALIEQAIRQYYRLTPP